MKIAIGKKALKDGKLSLYLDYTLNGKRTKEYLRLYVSGNKRRTPKDREVYELAEKIRSKRENEINTGMHGFVNKERLSADFVSFCRKMIEEEAELYRRGEKGVSGHGTNKSAFLILEEYTGGSLRFSQLDVVWLEDLKKHLERSDFSPRTQVNYFSAIRRFIDRAFREGIIKINPVPAVKHIKKGDAEKVYLLEEELETLINSPCKSEEWRRAFLFSCFTGLRLSDIQKITWDMLQNNTLHFRQQKTGGFEYLPLSKMALEILSIMRSESDGVGEVFFLGNLGRRSEILRTWAKSAGIDKQITFHSGRHTFATLLLTKGVDLYTVSKLLGHQDIQTTMIYAKIIDKVKDNAVDTLPVFDLGGE